MANFYYYLISSLPGLCFPQKPPFSYEKFLASCRDFIPENDFKIISNLPGPEDYELKHKHPLIAKWCLFDIALRNELVRVRASFKHAGPQNVLRKDGFPWPEIVHSALAAERNPSILEAERFLDRLRWQALDELSFGYYFDLGFLIIYAYKLLILERWENINKADGEVLLEGVLS